MQALSEIEKVRKRIDKGVEFHDKMKGTIPTDNMDAQYDCPECDGSGQDAEKMATWKKSLNVFVPKNHCKDCNELVEDCDCERGGY